MWYPPAPSCIWLCPHSILIHQPTFFLSLPPLYTRPWRAPNWDAASTTSAQQRVRFGITLQGSMFLTKFSRYLQINYLNCWPNFGVTYQFLCKWIMNEYCIYLYIYYYVYTIIYIYYYILLYAIIYYYILLYTFLYYHILLYTILLYYIILYYIILYYIILYYIW